MKRNETKGRRDMNMNMNMKEGNQVSESEDVNGVLR